MPVSVNVIQTDAVPVMRDSWTLMAIAQAKDLKEACLMELDRRLKEQTPQMKEELESTLEALRSEILKDFDARVMQPVDGATRVSFEEAMVVRCSEFMPRLLRDLTKEEDAILDEIEGEVVSSPQNSATDQGKRCTSSR